MSRRPEVPSNRHQGVSAELGKVELVAEPAPLDCGGELQAEDVYGVDTE